MFLTAPVNFFGIRLPETKQQRWSILVCMKTATKVKNDGRDKQGIGEPGLMNEVLTIHSHIVAQ
jgi:hypothetical protein